jgi:hypothetical protein
MADITSFLVKGAPIEKVTIVSAGDTALPALTVAFSTSTFSTKESAIAALERVKEFLEGWTWPPNARS